MQKHLIKQVFVAIWMWWLVERRKKMGNLCMKSIIETVFCVDFFEYMVWPYQQHIFEWILYHFLIQSQESTIPNSFAIFSFGSVTSYYLKFSFSYSVISKNNSACVNIFLNFNCTISDCNFQCWICFFREWTEILQLQKREMNTCETTAKQIPLKKKNAKAHSLSSIINEMNIMSI